MKDSETDPNHDQLIRKSTRGASYQVAGGFWQMLLRIGGSVILARILTPEDFGIMGMVLLVTGLFSQVGFTGYTSAIIAKQDLNNTDLNTALLLSVVTGLLLSAMLFFSAPFFEYIFNATGLRNALQVSILIILLGAIGNVSTAQLSKNLRFGTITIISALGVSIEMSLVIWLAFSGYGYWSLIWAWLTAETLMTITRLFYAKWLPGTKISKESFRFIFRYFLSQFSNSILVYLIMNADRVVISWLLGSNAFGLYTFAIRLPSLIFARLASPASGVIFPLLSKRSYSGNSARIFEDYSKAARYLALMSFPLLVGLAALAEPLVLILWGKAWAPVIVPMQILCAAFAVSCVASPIGAIFLAGHRPGILAKVSLIKLPLSYLFVIIASLLWGLEGAAFGYFLRVLLIGFELFFAKRLFGASFSYLLKQLLPAATASLFCGVTALCVMSGTNAMGMSKIYGITIAIILGATAFFITLRLFFKAVLDEASSMARTLMTR